jgi:membrane protein YdbS with pleckstrin-like domain
VAIRPLAFRSKKDFLYILPCLIGMVYFLSFFFFHHRLPGSRYVLGTTRVITLIIVLVLIDKTHKYHGHLFISEDKGKTTYSLDVGIPIGKIEEMDVVSFKTVDTRVAE